MSKCGPGETTIKSSELKQQSGRGASHRRKDYTGSVFGQLTAVKFIGVSSDSENAVWLFRCKCGNEVERKARVVARGETKSCGCIKRKSIRDRLMLPDGQAIRNSAYASHLTAANKRGLRSHLPQALFESIAKKPCFYCGGMSQRRRYAKTCDQTPIDMNSIDRLNNESYYTLENSVPCCFECQKAKGVMPAEKYLEMCKRVAEHQKGKDGK